MSKDAPEDFRGLPATDRPLVAGDCWRPMGTPLAAGDASWLARWVNCTTRTRLHPPLLTGVGPPQRVTSFNLAPRSPRPKPGSRKANSQRPFTSRTFRMNCRATAPVAAPITAAGDAPALQNSPFRTICTPGRNVSGFIGAQTRYCHRIVAANPVGGPFPQLTPRL